MYDVIVIGAGNGGLSAAATLAVNKKKVLLVDRNIVPGGCATSFIRGRFEFEPSLHELCSVGTADEKGRCSLIFDEIGIKPNLISLNDAYRAITLEGDKYDVTMPVGIDNFIEKLEEICPGSKESMEKFKKLSKNVVEAANYFQSGKRNYLKVLLKYRGFMLAASNSVKDVLDYLGMPEKAQSILCTYWPYLGTSVKKLDSMFYMSMFDGYVRQQPVIPRYRSHELSSAFEKSIKDHDGEIWYNTNVDSLIYENGRVRGIRIKDKEIYSKEVICSAFPEKVYADMLPKEAVPERAHKLINARDYGVKFYTVYLGLNKTIEEFGIKDYTIVINHYSDPVKQYECYNDLDKTPVFINFLNAAIPDCSPEGTSMVYISAMAKADYDDGINDSDYVNWKRSIADKLIKRCEDALNIDLRSSIEEIEICTPSTFSRYMGSPYGTPYGYEVDLWDSCTIRTLSKPSEKFIKGLTFVGAHTEMGDGYSTTYTTGQTAAYDVLKELKK